MCGQCRKCKKHRQCRTCRTGGQVRGGVQVPIRAGAARTGQPGTEPEHPYLACYQTNKFLPLFLSFPSPPPTPLSLSLLLPQTNPHPPPATPILARDRTVRKKDLTLMETSLKVSTYTTSS